MSELLIPEKYEPLFKIPEAKLVLDDKSNAISNVEAEKLAKIDIIIVTGGRNSGKSYTVSLADAYWTEHYNYRTLFTRYTLISAEDTIIADFMEKLDILGFRKFFRVRKDRVSHRVKKAKVVFKGIKTSAGNQTANLKSLKDFNVFLLDEGEEMDSFTDWQKIYLSMRANDVQNLSIISMNPSDKEFWVYKKFFEERGVEEGFNGIVGNILYIHTTYLDLDPSLIASNVLAEANRLKIEDPEEYGYIFLGKWRENVKGAVFKRHEMNYFSMMELMENDPVPIMKIGFVDVADEGIDYLSFPIGYLIGQLCYVVDWYFTKDDNTDISIPMTAEYCQIHKLDYVAVETNGMGSIFSKELNKLLPYNTDIIEVKQSSKSGKHTRILDGAGSVKMRMVFRNDVAIGGMYHLAMTQLFKYNRDKSLNKNDDAPDSISGLQLLSDDLRNI